MMARPEHFPDIDDKLRLFILYADSGKAPPDWLMQFMADGAREFLRAGKPWQRGKGGRPKGAHGVIELKAHLLSYHGELTAEQVARVLGQFTKAKLPATGKMRAAIKRGAIAFAAHETDATDWIRLCIRELLKPDFIRDASEHALTNEQTRELVAGLKAELARLERDEGEPAYEC